MKRGSSRVGIVLALALTVAGSGIVAANRRRIVEELEHQYQRVSFQWIADRVTQGASDPQTAVVRLAEYVHATMRVPPSGKPVGDVEPLELLAGGRGWCDQQANVFAQLARTIPLDVRLVFLRNAQGESPHSIAEVFLDGAWRVVDPFLGVLPWNDGRLATPEDLAANPSLFLQQDVEEMVRSNMSMTTAQLFRYPPTIFNTWRGKRKIWLDRCPQALRRGLVYALQDLSFAFASSSRHLTPPQRLSLFAQQCALLDRTKKAERLFQRVLQQTHDPALREDAQFFLGRLYRAQGRFDEALAVFQEMLRSAQGDGWQPLAHLACGQIYESLGQAARAREEYRLSGLALHEIMVAQDSLTLQRSLNDYAGSGNAAARSR